MSHNPHDETRCAQAPKGWTPTVSDFFPRSGELECPTERLALAMNANRRQSMDDGPNIAES